MLLRKVACAETLAYVSFIDIRGVCCVETILLSLSTWVAGEETDYIAKIDHRKE